MCSFCLIFFSPLWNYGKQVKGVSSFYTTVLNHYLKYRIKSISWRCQCKASYSLLYKVPRLVGVNHLRTWKDLFVYFVKRITFQALTICFFYFKLHFSLYLEGSLSCIDLKEPTDSPCVRILCIVFNTYTFNWISKVPFYHLLSLYIQPHIITQALNFFYC